MLPPPSPPFGTFQPPPAFQPPPGWKIPQESVEHYKSGSYRWIVVCCRKCKPDCAIWEATSVAFGSDVRLRRRCVTRDGGCPIPIQNGSKLSAGPAGPGSWHLRRFRQRHALCRRRRVPRDGGRPAALQNGSGLCAGPAGPGPRRAIHCQPCFFDCVFLIRATRCGKPKRRPLWMALLLVA